MLMAEVKEDVVLNCDDGMRARRRLPIDDWFAQYRYRPAEPVGVSLTNQLGQLPFVKRLNMPVSVGFGPTNDYLPF